MHMFWKNLQQLFRDIRHQKLRTALTLFGIIWGSVAIILLLTFGEAFYSFSSKAAHGMGEGICIMWGSRTAKPYQGFNRGRIIRFRESDITIMKEQIPELGLISAEYSRGVKVRVGKEGYSTNLSAVYPEFEKLRNMIPAPGGRFLNRLDMENRRRVVFIGNQVEEDLFGKGNGLGKKMFINSIPFRVIGVLQEKVQSSNYNGGDDGRILIPASTYVGIFGDRFLSNMVYKATDVRLTGQMKDKVYEILAKQHKFDSSDREALSIWDTTEMEKFFNSFFSGFSLFLGIVGVMTLIVGGIGVSNIMHVVVEERTREIGIKKALGAKRRLILGQYLGETLFIVALGGMIGYAVSTGMVYVANLFPIDKYVGVLTISPAVSIITVSILGCTGLIAGWFPAKRAARMDPVTAIKA